MALFRWLMALCVSVIIFLYSSVYKFTTSRQTDWSLIIHPVPMGPHNGVAGKRAIGRHKGETSSSSKKE